jgi:glucose dehydrogenase
MIPPRRAGLNAAARSGFIRFAVYFGIMPISPFPQWAQEMSSSGPRPTADQVLSLALLVVVVVVVWIVAANNHDRAATEHRQDRQQACADLRRLERMGIHAGSNHAVLVRRCGATPAR